ncbi:MAG: hypothetical protein MUO19_00940 [Dehalococcoidales bacterium]|nr:hypothetical protein [Dehalococcoidales bacterium]
MLEIQDHNPHQPHHAGRLDAPPRALLYYATVVIQLLASALSGVGFVLETPAYFLGGAGIWVAWFVLVFMMTRPATDGTLGGHVKFFRRGAGTIFIILFVVGIMEVIAMTVLYPVYYENDENPGNFSEVMTGLNKVFEYNDSTILTQQASENLLEGKNPYAHANIVEGLIEYEGAYDRVTPLRAGRFTDIFPYPELAQFEELWEEAILNPAQPPPELESRVSYPAGSFLLPAPFIAVGITDIRIIYAVFAVAGLLYAVWRIPGRRRLVFIGGVLVSLEFWNSIAAGETSITCFPLLLVAWLSLGRNNWVSAVFMGIAVATKQTAWFVLPFYLIYFFHTAGPGRIPAAFGIITGIFAAFNLPFIVADPGLWLSSVVSPMTDPMFPLGVGIINLVTSGIIDIRSALPFTVMEILGIAAALVWYYRNCPKYPHAGLILAVAPLFLAWRSLWNYFFYVGIIAFAAVMAGDGEEKETGRLTTPG